MPGRPLAAPQQGQGHAGAGGAHPGEGAQRARREGSGHAQGPHRQRRPLRPHSHLQLPAGPHHRPPHQPHAVQAAVGDGGRPRRGGGRVAAGAQGRTARGAGSGHGSGAPVNVAGALAAGATLGLARLDTQLLLLHALHRREEDRAWLHAHDTDVLSPVQQAAFMSMCERRLTGEPVAYLVGHKEFHGLRLQVDRRVLVPRPDTETLVDWAVETLGLRFAAPQPRGATGGMRLPCRLGCNPSIADLGTGSGAIALAIKKVCPDAHVTAIDASEAALQVARANAEALGLPVDFRQGDWLAGVEESFDLIVSNPPYVAAGDPHLAHLAHEPLAALASGADGLDDIRRIVAGAPTRLRPGGWLLLEHGWDQAASVRALLSQSGFTQVASRLDLAGIERCSGGRLLELG
ncbi:MAG: peptide chain release factor N(5)-glutamine methyltransferase [Burkholderiales bacterium]|nr:peptide chain release factor N(5)-glutamine methyltransferase [Burkholderiales bacterium]